MDLHVVMADHAIRSEVLAFEVHVDRHVIVFAASTYGRDEVDSNDAALLLNQLSSVLGDEEFHT